MLIYMEVSDAIYFPLLLKVSRWFRDLLQEIVQVATYFIRVIIGSNRGA